MNTASDRHENQHRRSALAWMAPTTVALLAALVLLGGERDGSTPSTRIAAPEHGAAAGLVDRSALGLLDLAEEAEQPQLSVAAYGN